VASFSTMSSLAGAYGGLPLSLLHGEVVDGTTKQTGSLLDALSQILNVSLTRSI